MKIVITRELVRRIFALKREGLSPLSIAYRLGIAKRLIFSVLGGTHPLSSQEGEENGAFASEVNKADLQPARNV